MKLFLPSSLLFLVFTFITCNSGPKIIDDLSDKSFEVLNQNGKTVIFPDDYKGKYVVAGFIYTNCPDICPLVTQNLIKVQKEFSNPDDIQFLGITFDPKRDTPEVLKNYKGLFNLDKNFDFLTADSTTIAELMDSVRVRSQVSFTQVREDDKEVYFMNHSDKIIVLDKKGRIIFEYGGSMTPVSYIVEDLQTVRR
ncbi:MAG TPA: SCO family protein [Balneola sp.]|jgi:protein SCO1|nr:SCO family protein [Balneola sp.]MAO77723.1 SCO family protein [Balneola sp.]MBF63864.1 SCO family protein [Balneola sp.]HAH52393.1 SCO family protein [Balneola sp.]HBZ37372.1 SCO family protein [Balneola sp.]|tara:strand:- start:5823 stop:6407 length:585 start_codon:yes stop_codon:yes gene_type:complete